MSKKISLRRKDKQLIAAYYEQLSANPTDLAVYDKLARKLIRLRKYEEAIKVCESGLQNNPLTAGLYHLIGWAYLRLSRYDDAEFAAKQVLNIDPQSSMAHASLGAILVEKQQLAEGIAQLQHALSLDAENAWAYQILSNAYGRSSKYAEALHCMECSFQLAPSFLKGLGLLVLRAGANSILERLRFTICVIVIVVLLFFPPPFLLPFLLATGSGILVLNYAIRKSELRKELGMGLNWVCANCKAYNTPRRRVCWRCETEYSDPITNASPFVDVPVAPPVILGVGRKKRYRWVRALLIYGALACILMRLVFLFFPTLGPRESTAERIAECALLDGSPVTIQTESYTVAVYDCFWEADTSRLTISSNSSKIGPERQVSLMVKLMLANTSAEEVDVRCNVYDQEGRRQKRRISSDLSKVVSLVPDEVEVGYLEFQTIEDQTQALELRCYATVGPQSSEIVDELVIPLQ